MNLYLIEQDDVGGWDTYDAAVVCAESEDQARLIHPGGGKISDPMTSTWTRDPHKVTVTLIGFADDKIHTGVVLCSSFNAG